MAGKPPKKSTKSTSSPKNTVKPASTVTRIDAAKDGETRSRVPQIVNAATADQKTADRKTADHKVAHHEIAEQIRIRAYELFEQRGRHEGHDHEDWVRAEAEILLKYQRGKSA
jgi:uncharacterized protein HemX